LNEQSAGLYIHFPYCVSICSYCDFDRQATGFASIPRYVAAVVVDAPVGIAVLLLPYDLREMTMLGDGGANALGALLGLNSVDRLTGKGRWLAIAALAGLTIVGERTSLGSLIERTPGLMQLDSLGRRS